jgi:hypothetical protein
VAGRQLRGKDAWSMQTSPAERGCSSGQRWFLLGLAALFVVLSIQYSVKASGHGERANRSAIQRWREQLLHLGDENIYDQYNYPNPPIMAMLLQPIAHLPPFAGSLVWFYLKLGLALVTLGWLFRMIESPERPFPGWAKNVTVLLSLRPIMGDLSHGNVNLFILFLVAGALYAFHRSRDWIAGLSLGLAIACKLTPALFMPYLLWKRAWKALAASVVGLILFLILIPGITLGQRRNLDLLQSWIDNMVAPYVVAGTVTSDHLNQSLPGLVYRLTTHSPSIVDDKGILEPQYDNLAELDPSQAGWIIRGCMLLFAGLIVWTCRTPLATRRGWRLGAEFSLVVVGMLLFSERTWKHHCVTLMFPFAVITYYVATCQPRPLLRGYLLGSLAAVFLLMTSTSSTGIRLLEPFDEAAKRAHVYGAYVWAYAMLVAALVVMLKCTSQRTTALVDTSRPVLAELQQHTPGRRACELTA